MKHKKIKATIVIAAITALAIAFSGGSVYAHNSAVSAACNEGQPLGHVSLTNYADDSNASHKNTVDVFVDGVSVVSNPDFGTTYNPASFNLGSGFVSHTFRVKVHAWDDQQFSFDTTKNVPACSVQETTTTSTTTTLPQQTTTTVAPTTTVPQTTTTTAPGTTTTVQGTTTTVAATTTTVPAATTTEMPPGTTTTTAFIPPPPEIIDNTPLPETGAGTVILIIIAILVIGVGAVILFGSKKLK